MIQTIIGKKIDQTQTFLENGQRIPVTEIAFPEHAILQVKTPETDAYSAVQIGVGMKKKPGKALLGHAKKAGRESAPAKIKEVSLLADAGTEPKPGDTIELEAILKAGDVVKVTGTSKGKGFAGGVKRHGFRGGPKTHGQSDRHRAPGAIGQGTTPGRVYKGKRMAGRMGSDTVTVSNLTVVEVDPANGKILVAGLVPGYKNSWVYLTKTGENKKFVPILSVASDTEQPVVTPEESVVTPAETVKEPVETVEAPAEGEVAEEAKEVAADVEMGEKKEPTASEKEAMSEKAEENVAAEKAEEAQDVKESAAAEAANVDEKTQEKKAAAIGDSGEPVSSAADEKKEVEDAGK